MMNIQFSKRMKVSLLAGAALGVVCMIGALIRSGGGSEAVFLFALWYNRLLMGMVIGLMEDIKETPRLILRGAVTGLLVSFAFYSADGFGDAVSFLAGIVYGIIIELAARRR